MNAGLALAALAVAATTADACKCMQPPTVSAALRGSDAVFAAVVDSVSIARPASVRDGYDFTLARLRVFRTWKGPHADSIVAVRTGLGGGDCGYGFRAGDRHLVWANRSPNGMLTTTICTRTRPFPEARADSIELDALASRRRRR